MRLEGSILDRKFPGSVSRQCMRHTKRGKREIVQLLAEAADIARALDMMHMSECGQAHSITEKGDLGQR